jgi:hypothetical protein
MPFYDKCLKCRGLDTRKEAECRCPKNSKEKLKDQAEQLNRRGGEK